MTESQSIDPTLYEESSNYRPEVHGELLAIYDTNDLEELKKHKGAHLSYLAIHHRFNDTEVNTVAAAVADQTSRLTAPDEAFLAPDLPEFLPTVQQEVWSPTAILNTIKDRPRDFRELAANDR